MTLGLSYPTRSPRRKEARERKKKSDDKPETLTAYQAFFRHNFEELKAEAVAKNGGAKTKSNGIVSIIGQRWRELDGAAKASWEGSTIPQRQSLQRPKPRSLTAYQLFFRETAVELAPLKAVGSLTQNEIVRTIGERWRSIEPHTYLDLQVRAAAEATRLAAEGEEEMRARVAAHTLAHVADAESTCSAALGRLAAEAAEEERVHVAAQALAHGAEDVESTCSAALRRLAAEAAGEESALVAAQALAHIAADAEFTCSAALGIQKNAGLSAVPPGFAAI